MKKIKVKKFTKKIRSSYFKNNAFSFIINFIIQNSHSILISINFALTMYLYIQNNLINTLNNELSSSRLNYKKEDLIVDEDMVGLKYPKIQFEEIKDNFLKGKIMTSIIDFFIQLETKLIYLEKEINGTKLNSFYTTRMLYLKSRNVRYDDANIKEYHDIINWISIHKSTQLKGIASDKYLACKYVKIKLGKDLCPHRIGVFNNVEEIDFNKIVKMGNVVLKVTNGFSDNIFITEKNNDTEKIKNDLIFHYNRDYPLNRPSFFHFFSKKRIVLEKMFVPVSDLYEFKFLIFNRAIKMILLEHMKNGRIREAYYDENFNSVYDAGTANFDMSKLDKKVLNEMKSYAIGLSEDFPNFIRVDLYIFHDKVYLSELTFDSHSGIPTYRNIKHFTDGVSTWKRVDY